MAKCCAFRMYKNSCHSWKIIIELAAVERNRDFPYFHHCLLSIILYLQNDWDGIPANINHFGGKERWRNKESKVSHLLTFCVSCNLHNIHCAVISLTSRHCMSLPCTCTVEFQPHLLAHTPSHAAPRMSFMSAFVFQWINSLTCSLCIFYWNRVLLLEQIILKEVKGIHNIAIDSSGLYKQLFFGSRAPFH